MISKLFPYQELLCHSRPALRVVVAGGGDGSGGGGVCVCLYNHSEEAFGLF